MPRNTRAKNAISNFTHSSILAISDGVDAYCSASVCCAVVDMYSSNDGPANI